MDVTIHEALAAATAMLKALDDNQDIPPFFTDPLGGVKH
jgi:hypothetical protein